MAKQGAMPKTPSGTGKSSGGFWSWLFFGVLGFLWANKEEAWDWLCKQYSQVVEWWKGKKIAIIGPPQAGKNCLFCRLQGQPVPTEHHGTKNPETISQFRFERTLPDKSIFHLHCKRSVNVGGEEEQRERHWLDACRDADVIFYMLTVQDLLENRYGEGSRIDNDCAWLARHLGRMKSGTRVHFLVNKIDLVVSKPDELERVQKKLGPDIDELEKRVRFRFGGYGDRLTGMSPISMLNDNLFECCLPLVLKAIYDAIHPAK